MNNHSEFGRGHVASLKEEFQREGRLKPLGKIPPTIDVSATPVIEMDKSTQESIAPATEQHEVAIRGKHPWKKVREIWRLAFLQYKSFKSLTIRWLETLSDNQIFKTVETLFNNRGTP